MRTTLAIDDDVLAAAKSIADVEQKTLGQVVSELARRSLRQPGEATIRNGIVLLPVSRTGAVVTPEEVNTLRDEEP
jgi:hypothetical protein